LLKLARAADPNDPWYAPTLAGTLRNREPELVNQLYQGIASADAEASALTVAWQINRAEAVPFLAGVLQAPKAPEHFQKALDALSWIKNLSAGEAVATAAVAAADASRVRAALETLQRRIASDWRPLVEKPVFTALFQKSTNDATLLPGMLTLIGAAQAKAFVPPVLELVDRPHLDRSSRRAALEALGQIRTPETWARLETIVKATRLPEQPSKVVPPTDELAFAALNATQAAGTPEAGKLLETVILDRRYPIDL